MSQPAASPFWPAGFDVALLAAVSGPLGLAVSGGSDSAALAALAHEAGFHDAVVLTVDHGLRPGSAEDAGTVVALAGRLGLSCHCLRAGPHDGSSVQAWARNVRYGLLRDAAQRLGLAAIVTAHTLDDQAETLLLRLGRGSGLRGLGAIRADTVQNGLRILRPLLAARRADLRAALVARNISWRDDPSNVDTRFARVAVRKLAPALEAAGLTAARLADAAAHLARASTAIDDAVASLAAAALRVDRAGAVIIARAPFAVAAEEVRLRLLSDAVQMAGGNAHGPRFDALSIAADMALRGAGRTTLGRTVLDAGPADIVLWREARGIRPVDLAPGGIVVFDGRYEISLAAGIAAVKVAPLGAAAALCPALGHARARATAPAIFRDGRFLAAPTLGVVRHGFERAMISLRRMR
ncbi:tRNA lysidine(34) synthetase TilS [Acuticoccus sp. MNP-M23]|uniref:tRNA lysidine(34) synthetase TilS n=1 Tax=Acuticoccus sp. MNP-M23 TaxID=3072793 RepID=UPI002815EEFA|nr:tRNA lysidine(34) synthetase TilS [Acuticoccus sp. MNP-M23]WMS43857.1 tRNA lysidine(34) synthetase TilS [Acuticoccus sp. MNP-M23]